MEKREVVAVEIPKKRTRKTKVEVNEAINQAIVEAVKSSPKKKDLKRMLKLIELKDYKVIAFAHKVYNTVYPDGVFVYSFMAFYVHAVQKMQKHKQFVNLSKRQFRAMLSNKYRFNKMLGQSQTDREAYLKSIEV